jgi:hypothetical protein
MRTKTLLLTAALAAAGVATSMAQGVFSVNTVGYVNVTLKPGFNLVSNPLKASNQTVAELFKNIQGGVPVGFQVFTFSPTTGFAGGTANWDEFDNIFTGAGASVVVEPGEGAFVRNSATTDKVLTFVGEVQTQAVNPLPAGFSIKGSEIPIEGTVAALGFPGVPGDQIFKFNPNKPGGPGYDTYNFDEFDLVWTPTPPMLAPGEGIFVRKTAAGSWTQSFTIQ